MRIHAQKIYILIAVALYAFLILQGEIFYFSFLFLSDIILFHHYKALGVRMSGAEIDTNRNWALYFSILIFSGWMALLYWLLRQMPQATSEVDVPEISLFIMLFLLLSAIAFICIKREYKEKL